MLLAITFQGTVENFAVHLFLSAFVC